MPDQLAAEVSKRIWYHTIELPGSIRTPGIFNTVAAAAQVPMPASLQGMRCLDIATADGFWAFEMERRGASEVVAVDIGRVPLSDPARSTAPPDMALRDPRPPATFELAHQALASTVEWRALNVYDLSPGLVGSFDFVFLGSVLLHLRDPFRALAATKSVTAGDLLVNEAVSLPLTLQRPRLPVAKMAVSELPVTWWVPNAAGLRLMIEASGFAVRAQGRPYMLRYGPGRKRMSILAPPPFKLRPLRGVPGAVARQLGSRLGETHAWVLAAP